MSLTKVCGKCHCDKPLSDFYKNKSGRLGAAYLCKECDDKRKRQWRKENKDKVNARSAVYRRANPGKMRAAKNRWKDANKERAKTVDAIWRANNLEKVREKGRRAAAKLRSTPKGKMRTNLSNAIKSRLKGGKAGRSTFDILGYSVEDLMRHLEKKFLPGMSWDNYGLHGWHIDHKIPVSAFCFETINDMDFKRCWALSNLQPMWAKDNLSKQDKLEKPFQPCLAIEDFAAPKKKKAA